MITLSERVVESKSGGIVSRWKMRRIKVFGFTVYTSQVLLDETPTVEGAKSC